MHFRLLLIIEANHDQSHSKHITRVDPEGRGGQGVWNPSKNHKNIGFLSNTGQDPLKNHKATKPAFNVGQSSADDGPFIVVFGSSIPSSTKKRFQIGTPSDKTFWIRAHGITVSYQLQQCRHCKVQCLH